MFAAPRQSDVNHVGPRRFFWDNCQKVGLQAVRILGRGRAEARKLPDLRTMPSRTPTVPIVFVERGRRDTELTGDKIDDRSGNLTPMPREPAFVLKELELQREPYATALACVRAKRKLLVGQEPKAFEFL